MRPPPVKAGCFRSTSVSEIASRRPIPTAFKAIRHRLRERDSCNPYLEFTVRLWLMHRMYPCYVSVAFALHTPLHHAAQPTDLYDLWGSSGRRDPGMGSSRDGCGGRRSTLCPCAVRPRFGLNTCGLTLASLATSLPTPWLRRRSRMRRCAGRPWRCFNVPKMRTSERYGLRLGARMPGRSVSRGLRVV